MTELSMLGEACPSGLVESIEDDAVAGVIPRFVAHPRSPSEVADVIRAAGGLGMPIVARGAGTKLDWGTPPETAGLLVDLSQLSTVLEHEVSDLVVRVEAGCRIAELQQLLGRAGQRLPVDEMVEGSTVGGAVAVGLCGPLRHRFGAIRDTVLGVSFVRADGVVAKSGSKVVKNVAGYDLAKLLTGSYGTLGVITEIIFRVRPLPRYQAFVSSVADDEDDAGRRLTSLARSSAAPTAVEVHRVGPGPIEIAVLLEASGSPSERVAAVSTLLGPTAAEGERPEWWGRLPGVTTVKLAVPRASVPLALGVGSGARLPSDSPVISGSAGVGVLYCGLGPGTAVDDAVKFIRNARESAEGAGGSAVVLRAPSEIRDAVDVWGDVGGLGLMRRVKAEFDPERLLSPGRFVGGI